MTPSTEHIERMPVAAVTVRCPQCTLEKAFEAGGVFPADWTDEGGHLVCPNCSVPMQPIGERVTAIAEQAFKEAQQELAAEGKVEPLPPAETVETLSKRLHEIERAHARVMAAQDRYESKHDAAKEAKKHLDNETETFLTVAGRLSAVSTPLPLFTEEAEKAAALPAPSDEPGPGEVHYTGLYTRLVEAGYQAVSMKDLSAWTPEQRLEADTWAKDDQTEAGLPAFMRALAEAISAAHGLQLEGPRATTPVSEAPAAV